MADFILFCGIPGSGKTYLGRAAADTGKCVLISSDDIREILWGDVNDQRNPKRVFEEMEKLTLGLLTKGYNVIYDATNLKRENRIAILNKVRELDSLIDASCIIFDIPLDICIQRATERDRVVPEEVIRRMYKTMEKPTYNEGWDLIVTAQLGEENETE